MSLRHNILTQIKKRTIILFVFLFAFMPLMSAAAQETATQTSEKPGVPAQTNSSIEKPPTESQKTNTDETRVPPEPGEFPDSPEDASQEKINEEPQSAIMAITDPAALSTNLTPSTIKQLIPYADETTGALVYSFPIVIPPGRNNLQPDTRLVYSNQLGDDGSLFGYGWSLSTPSIERVNKTGSDEIYSSAFFSSSLSGELVQLSPTSYGSKTDNGEFFEYTFSGNSWTARDKKGTIYSFGSTSDSRQDNPSNASEVYKWMLAEIRDRNDNFVSFNYYKNNGQIYPQTIFYTGHGTVNGIFSVEFVREARPDISTSHNTAFDVTTNERVSRILTKINGSLARSYDLAYSGADNGARSILTSITESGHDVSGSIQLPPILIEYQTSTPGWTQNTSWSLPVGFAHENSICSNWGVRVADINADGLPDLLKSVVDSAGSYTQAIYLNTGTGWSLSTSWALPQIPFAYSGWCSGDYGTQVIDINGDALADIIRYRAFPSTSSVEHDVYLNTGSGWIQNFTWTIPQPLTIEWSDFGTRLADVNGDGLVDVLWNRGNNAQGVAINNGSNWVIDSSWTVPVAFRNSNSTLTRGVEIADINNDGLADIIDSGNNNGQFVYINNGHGWTLSSTWVFPAYLKINDRYDYGTRIADVNGDSLADVVVARIPENSNVCTRSIYINNGSNWVLNPLWTTPGCFVTGGIGRDLGARLFDANGDGMVDFISSVYTNSTPVVSQVYLANGLRADEAHEFTSSSGGSTSIVYKTPQQYTNSATLLNPLTPFVFDSVFQITHDNGLGAISSYTYTYEGGAYYFGSATDRKFAGFHIRTRTDSDGNVVRDYFHQGNSTNSALGETSDHVSKVGKTYRTEVQNTLGQNLSVVINSWDRTDLGFGRNFTKLASTLRFDYDGNATHRDRAVNYAYNDTNGNLTYVTEWGEVIGNPNGTFSDAGSDKKITAVSYASNSSYHILNLPSQETITDQSGAKISETKSYYDNQQLGSVNIGNKTREEKWKTGSIYTDTERTYNSFGFVTQELDPRNKQTNYVPDTHNLYPVTISNALGQTTSYVYDYSSGKPSQITDPNGGISQTAYDALDRATEERQSNPTTASTLEIKTTYEYVPQVVGWRTKQSEWLDASISRDMYSYTDGFDRLIQTREESETANTFATADTIYSSREYIWKQSLPYFSTGIARTTPTSTQTLLSTFSYDALGRTTNIANAVGSTSSVYDQWATSVTDPRGKLKTYIKDAYERLVGVEEHNSSTTYTTTYQYNLRGDLIQITDALGNSRSFTYDGLSRRLTAQDLHALSDTAFGTWTYTYDDAGNISSTLDPKNQTIQYVYDDLNRVLTENFTGATGIEITYTYDSCPNGVGHLCSVTKTGFSESNSYDELGRISSQIRSIDGTPYTTSFTYDKQGHTTLVTNPDSSQVQYSYNSAGLLNSLNRKEGSSAFTPAISNIDYSPTSKRTVVSYANGSTTTNTYDANELYRLRTKITSTPTGNQQHLTYFYDANGNITQIVDASNTQSAKTTTYTYDDLNRLLSATVNGAANGQNGAQTYAYDAIGNITSRSDVPGLYEYNGTAASNYANPHAATTVGTTTNAYDQNGNLTTSTSVVTTTSTPPVTPSWYTGTPGTWTKRLPLTVQQNQISGTSPLTNFPLLVSITNTNLKSTANGGFVASASGNDILFTASDGITKLDHEIESYNATAGSLVAWVRVPSVSATVNTTVCLYFGNSSAPNQQNPTGVWGTNYKGVWHMKENPSLAGATINDSTSNGYNGTPYGSMPASASSSAKIGQGLTFDGADDHLNLGIASSIGNLTNNYTVSVWIRSTNLSGTHRIISPKRFNSNNGFALGTEGSTPRISTYGIKEYNISNTLSFNVWQRLDVVMQNNNASYYRNGTLLGTVTHTSAGVANTDDVLLIGATSPVGANTSTQMYQGILDELRVYSGTRTQNWIQAEYINQNSPSLFVSVGAVQSIPVPTTTTTNVTTTYGWDYGNRLISIASPSLSASFTYDHNGTRVKSLLGATTTKYPTSSYGVTGATATKHISLDDGELVLTLEGTGASTTPRYVHTDHLTGSSVITNSAGAQVQLLDYHPFGTSRINNQSSSFDEKRKFAGHEYDTETGLSYMLARYYDPATGRFLSEDPVFVQLPAKYLEGVLTDPQQLNSYAYGRNNPLVYRDPDGYWSLRQIDQYANTIYKYEKFVGDLLTLGMYSIGLDMIEWNVNEFVENPSLTNGAAAIGSVPASTILIGAGALTTSQTIGAGYSVIKSLTSLNKLYGRSGNYIPGIKKNSLPSNVSNSLDVYEKNGWQKVQGLEMKQYHNNEGYLPPGQTYHQYDVNLKTGPTRDTQRFFRGDSDGRVFFTDTHMETNANGTRVNVIQ